MAEQTTTKSMGKDRGRVLFEWFRQHPKLRCEPLNDQFQLISDEDLEAIIQEKHLDAESEAVERLRQDLAHLRHELMPHFRARDYAAHCDQNRYRLFQVGFIGLAALATFVGSLQVWALDNAPNLILIIGLAETFIALVTTFIANLMGNDNPFLSWLNNRQQAEQLRREFFRYVTDAEPYTRLTGAARRKRLALRAAAINKGADPDKILNEG
jgi:hypothetical protein